MICGERKGERKVVAEGVVGTVLHFALAGLFARDGRRKNGDGRTCLRTCLLCRCSVYTQAGLGVADAGTDCKLL